MACGRVPSAVRWELEDVRRPACTAGIREGMGLAPCTAEIDEALPEYVKGDERTAARCRTLEEAHQGPASDRIQACQDT